MLIDLSWILKITYVKNIAQYLEYISFFFLIWKESFHKESLFFMYARILRMYQKAKK